MKNAFRQLKERELEYSRIHSHGGESGVDFFAERVAGVTREWLRWVELVFAAEFQRRKAVVLPYFVQV